MQILHGPPLSLWDQRTSPPVSTKQARDTVVSQHTAHEGEREREDDDSQQQQFRPTASPPAKEDEEGVSPFGPRNKPGKTSPRDQCNPALSATPNAFFFPSQRGPLLVCLVLGPRNSAPCQEGQNEAQVAKTQKAKANRRRETTE